MLLWILVLALLIADSFSVTNAQQQQTTIDENNELTTATLPLAPFAVNPDNTAASFGQPDGLWPTTTAKVTVNNGGHLENNHRRRNDSEGREIVTVAVIGSGMAGITAARQLTDRTKFDVVVLEANTERYGGRLWSYEVPGFRGTYVSIPINQQPVSIRYLLTIRDLHVQRRLL